MFSPGAPRSGPVGCKGAIFAFLVMMFVMGSFLGAILLIYLDIL